MTTARRTGGGRAGAQHDALASAPPGSERPPGGAAETRPVTDPTRFDRLSRRHRECLRGVRALKGSKEIADDFGIEKSTVDSYLAEAVKVLGARNRRDAALQLAEHERAAEARNAALAPGIPAAFEEPPSATVAPDKMGGHSARMSEPAPALPWERQPDEVSVRQPGGAGARPATGRSPGMRLPFRRTGQRGNDLSVGDRLVWIQVITLGIAIGFGMLMIGLQILAGLIDAVVRHLS